MKVEDLIIYEDNHILVVIKPQNIPSQEDSSKDKDMLNILKDYIKVRDKKEGNVYLGLVHRLDRPTGGVMVFAKTSKAASRLSEQIKNGGFEKKYIAVLANVPKDKKAHLVHYLKKNEATNVVSIVPSLTTGAKKAELDYTVLDTKDNLCLVSVHLLTGRGHQIRVQMSAIKCPVYGDQKYGDENVKSNLALWAYNLQFEHPTTKEKLNFTVFPPEDLYPFSEFDINRFLSLKQSPEEY